MKSLLYLLGCWSVAIFSMTSHAEETAVTCRITADLRDGSRVVGTPTENYFHFRSSLLGKLKLAARDIRSIEGVSSNSFKVITANGDQLTVGFDDSNLTIKAGFGNVEVAIPSIRRLSIASVRAPGTRVPGLLALWSGEEAGNDVIGQHDPDWVDVAYAEGKVGRGFLMNGYSTWATIPESRALDFSNADGLTVTAWIKPNNVDGFHPIMEWEVTREKGAVQFWVGHLPQDRGVLCGYIATTEHSGYQLVSPTGTLVTGQFQHVAMTYDKKSGVARLLVNGRVVTQQNIGTFTPDTAGPLHISRRPCDQPGDWTYNKYFSGVLDELSIYNRGLSTEEIRDICTQENGGELPPAPSRPARQGFPSSSVMYSE